MADRGDPNVPSGLFLPTGGPVAWRWGNVVVDQVAQVVTQVVFVLIAALTAAEFVRDRGRRSRDAALMFAALAGIILIQLFTSVSTVQSRPLALIGSVMILAQPYLL